MTKRSADIEIFELDSHRLRAHSREFYLDKNGFLLCRRGSLALFMDDKEHCIGAGDLFIYPAFAQATVRCFSDDFCGIAGYADFDLTLSSLMLVSNTQSQFYIRFHPHVPLTPEQFGRAEEMVRLIRSRMERPGEIGRLVTEALAQAFCLELIEMYIANTRMTAQTQSRRDKIFQNFLVDLNRHCHTQRDVAFYAARQRLTPRYFATLVSQASGRSPGQWITMFVIIAAKQLLLRPQMSIKEIAERLNFSNQSFFGRYFKQYAGLSPSRYRALPPMRGAAGEGVRATAEKMNEKSERNGKEK